jgi:hypothetical protein
VGFLLRINQSDLSLHIHFYAALLLLLSVGFNGFSGWVDHHTLFHFEYTEIAAITYHHPENYRVVYDVQLETNELDGIYEKFNLNHPAGFQGHSLSMSDIIELYDQDGSTFHYVDRFGFKEIDFRPPGQEQQQGQTMGM